VQDFSFCVFSGVALGFGHGFGVADDHSGGASENFADGPCAVFIHKEDPADALLFGAVVRAAEERDGRSGFGVDEFERQCSW
jgi:hypothetical protein